ncbi:hypothetical protein GCM10017655_28770 [Pseudomonas turukhanskensis]|uniref:Uncharacterized protein n=2 Tax=Pseudomonas turukhanskensis TaxID=1806536 RepID=A0A9W6NGG9_9PSED|nr:hypothetical protein GCM10017655_28770 [Pseudomonas turukhanskensis]
MRPGNPHGVGIIATVANNTDPQFPYWNAYCGESDSTLCWPVSPRSEFVVPAGTSKVTVTLYAATGYGSASVNYEGTNIAMSFHAYDTQARRYYRLQTYANMPMTASTCNGSSPSRTLNPLSYESGVTRVYRLAHTLRYTTCTLTFDSLNLPTDTIMSVSFNAVKFRYDNDIYGKLPSGTHQFTSSRWADTVRYNFFDAEGNVTGSGELFDGVTISGWVTLEAYTEFSLISAPLQSISVGPDERHIRYAYFDTLLKTNMPKVTTTIRCQHVLDGSCALSDGNMLIPMSTGIRADRVHTATFTEALRPDKPLRLTADLGFAFHRDVYMVYMFGIAPSYLKEHPETFGKTFKGDVALIIDSDFE